MRDHAAFRLLFVGQALSVVGDRITPVAIAFAVLGLGSATDLGLVMAAGGIPFALFALAGGVWADHVGRRRVMLASDIIRAVAQTVTAVLLLTGNAEVWMLAVLSFVYGTAAAVFMPALIGLIPQTVGHERLQEANGLLALTRSVAERRRPGAGRRDHRRVRDGRGDRRRCGDVRGERAVPGADAAERRARGRGGAGATRPPTSRSSPGCASGWHEVRSRTWLMWGLIAMSVYHVFVLPSVFVLGPTLADSQLDGASSWAAIVACFGVGGVLGNVVALRIPLRRPVFIAALALVGASTQAAIIGSGLGTVGIAALELLAGVCVALFFTLWDLSIQEQVPAHAVSRVSAYDFSVSLGLMPLGMAMSGPIAEWLGLQATLIGMSASAWPGRSRGSPSRPCAACAGRMRRSPRPSPRGRRSPPPTRRARPTRPLRRPRSRTRRRARYRRTGPSTPLSERAPADDQR